MQTSSSQRTRADGPALWLGTSWKMTKTIGEALAYVEQLLTCDIPSGMQVFVLPAHTALFAVANALPQDSPVLLGAQDAHWARDGAVTGEVSMRMVRDAGASIVELGHSERRAAFGETDERIAWKVRAAVDSGLQPLVCVGESNEIRVAGGARDFVAGQVAAALSGLDPTEVARAMVAYEPVWAIGEHGRAATLPEVTPVLDSIHEVASTLSSTGRLRAVLYGGSVDADNISELVTADGVDGVFVGRAAWDAAGMRRLIEIAAQARGLPGT